MGGALMPIPAVLWAVANRHSIWYPVNLLAGLVVLALTQGTYGHAEQTPFYRWAVFIVAALLSVPTWGLSLLAATIIDLILYFALGDATLCYGCGALHRGFRKNPDHGDFDIHIQESVDRRVRTA